MNTQGDATGTRLPSCFEGFGASQF